MLFNSLGIEMQLGGLGGQRQFASVYRLRRLLSVLGCEIVHVSRWNAARRLRIPSQKVVLAHERKLHSRSRFIDVLDVQSGNDALSSAMPVAVTFVPMISRERSDFRSRRKRNPSSVIAELLA